MSGERVSSRVAERLKAEKQRDEEKRSLELKLRKERFELQRELISTTINDLHANFETVHDQDFDLSDYYPEACSFFGRGYPFFRQLKHNLYCGMSVPKCEEPENIPLCCCTPDSGCNESCQNRLLYMYELLLAYLCMCFTNSFHAVDRECGFGYCPSLGRCSRKRVISKSTEGDRQYIETVNRASVQGNGQLSYCSNTTIQRQEFVLVEVYPTDHCGYGLRVQRDIDEGTIIIEYLGKVITADECRRLIKEEYEEGDDFYFACLGGGLLLDARDAGSLARFANHSCEPSCELQKWSVLGNVLKRLTHIIGFAHNPIFFPSR